MLGLRPQPAPAPAGAAAAAASDLVKDATDATFVADVLEASRVQPVIVDFWATWCGPCKQLTPVLERVVKAAGGAVKLVKVDVDKNPRAAAQFRVQAMPTVYAVIAGQPVDGFQGALPESQVKAFVDAVIKAGAQAGLTGGGGEPGPDPVEELLAFAAEAQGLGDVGGAAQAYAQVLQVQPDNVKAVAGLARAYLAGGDAERAREILEMAPAGARDAELDSVRAALELASAGGGDLAALERRVQAAPDDHEARFEYAQAAYAAGHADVAVEHLLHIVARDRAWQDDGARKQLVKIFEAEGPTSDVTKSGRRRLSSLMFS